MALPMESQCLVGILHPMAFPETLNGEGPILETLRPIVEDDFFGAVEVSWIKDQAVLSKAASLLSSSGLEVVFAAQPPLLSQKLDLNSADSASRRAAVDQCRQLVDMAYQLGALMMAVVSGPDPGEQERPAAADRLVDSLLEICTYAQEQGRDRQLAINLENFDRSIDKKSLIGPTREAAEVAERVKRECSNFGLLIDLSHQPLLGEPAHQMVIDSIDHLIHVHVGNCVIRDRAHPAYGDCHPRFGIPGGENGAAELQRFLEALTYAGYFGKSVPTTRPVVSFEVRPQPGEDSLAVIANAKRTLRQAWAGMQR